MITMILNLLWVVLGGLPMALAWWLALGHLSSALACFVTIIGIPFGIPFGIQHIKLALIALAPVGMTVVKSRN